MIRSFLTALRASWSRTTLLAGVPLAAVAVGIAEIRHFSHGAALADHLAMGLDTGGLLITFMSLGYVFLLSARGTDLPAAEFWSLCARLGIRNLFRTGAFFLLEIATAITLTAIGPGLLLLGLPLFLLQLMRLTTQSGLRRFQF